MNVHALLPHRTIIVWHPSSTWMISASNLRESLTRKAELRFTDSDWISVSSDSPEKRGVSYNWLAILDMNNGILASTSVPGSARDIVSSPPNWRTRSRIPAIPTPRLDEVALPVIP